MAMMTLDPSFAQEALEIGADIVGCATIVLCTVVAPLLAGLVLFALAMLWGPR